MQRDPNTVGFNKIYVLQHLRQGDRRTGEEIINIIKYSSLNQKSQVLYELIDPLSPNHLLDTLRNIKNAALNDGILPYIHFEVHGCKDGLEINGELVHWGELKKSLLSINLAVKNNLFISVASCYGAYIFKILNLKEPCPFFGFIGPENEIFEEELEVNFSAFFESLLKENSFDAAIENLNSTVGLKNGKTKYAFMSCYGLFDLQAAEFSDAVKSSKGRNLLINQAISSIVERNTSPDLSINQIRQEAKELLRNGYTAENLNTLKKVFTHEA